MMFWKSSKRARARASASSTHAVGSSANVRGDGDEIPRTASPGLMEQELLDQVNFDHYKLPHAVDVAMNSWIENSNSMAVIMTLFAAVQIILIQILPNFGISMTGSNAGDAGNSTNADGADNSSITPATPLWRATSFFMYCGIFLHLGGAISAVVIMLYASTLPIRGRHLALTDPDSLPHHIFVSKAIYKAHHKHKEKEKGKKHHNKDEDAEEEEEEHRHPDDDDDDKDHDDDPIPIPLELLGDETALLAEWGLGRKFQIACIHMSVCFVLGFIASFLSVMLWVWSWEPSSHATKIGGALIPILLAAGMTFCFVLTG